jgi:hypothetical protein
VSEGEAKVAHPARPSLVARWVAFWDEREPPTILATIRILIALVMLWDLAQIGLYWLPVWLWAPLEAGGMLPLDDANLPALYQLLPRAPGSAVALWLALSLSMLSFGLGCFTRASALTFAILYTQAALINGSSDRGIDRAIRIVMMIFALAPAGRVWSLDALRRTGSWRGDGSAEVAWPRYLILGQLVLLYCAAGLAKGGTHWYPWGGYDALFLILQDPIFAARDFAWLAQPVPYFMTRVATAVTHLWEVGAPIVLVAAYYRRTAERPGRVRRLFNRLPVRNVYALIGLFFHLSLAVTMELGIFPFGMLALFPAFFRPEEVQRALARLRRLRPRKGYEIGDDRQQGSTSGE